MKTSRGDYACIYYPLPPNNTIIDCYFESDFMCPSFECNLDKYIIMTSCVVGMSGPWLIGCCVLIILELFTVKDEPGDESKAPPVNMDSVIYTNEPTRENSGSNDHTLSRS